MNKDTVIFGCIRQPFCEGLGCTSRCDSGSVSHAEELEHIPSVSGEMVAPQV